MILQTHLWRAVCGRKEQKIKQKEQPGLNGQEDQDVSPQNNGEHRVSPFAATLGALCASLNP
jgi:hypothetical protein